MVALKLEAAHVLSISGGSVFDPRNDGHVYCDNTVRDLNQLVIPTVVLEGATLRYDNSNTHGSPTERATDAHTGLNVCLNDQEDDGSPKDHFQPVEDRVGFQASPPAKSRPMVRQDLVEDDDHGFPALEQGWESDLGLDLNE